MAGLRVAKKGVPGSGAWQFRWWWWWRTEYSKVVGVLDGQVWEVTVVRVAVWVGGWE